MRPSSLIMQVEVSPSQSVLPDQWRGTIHGAEPGQRDTSVDVDFPIRAAVHAFDQVLLVQQRVVSPEGAGGVVEALVVVAELRLPARRQELVDVHHLAQ